MKMNTHRDVTQEHDFCKFTCPDVPHFLDRFRCSSFWGTMCVGPQRAAGSEDSTGLAKSDKPAVKIKLLATEAVRTSPALVLTADAASHNIVMSVYSALEPTDFSRFTAIFWTSNF